MFDRPDLTSENPVLASPTTPVPKRASFGEMWRAAVAVAVAVASCSATE